MNLNIDLNDKSLKILEELTSNAKQIQENLLDEILTLNSNTEYLQTFLHGNSDKKLFKTNVPIVTYEDIKPYIDRVANGESSHVISSLPITGFLLSSGTSGGKQKLFPLNNKYLENMRFIYDLRSLVISNHISGVEEGKGVMFLFTREESLTLSSLPATTSSTSFFKSKHFKNNPTYWYNSFTTPHQIFSCLDNKQTLYCHFLCGLIQRNQVTRIGAIFASLLIRAFTFLEKSWKELCSNIKTGELSDWIIDSSCRDSVSKLLKGPNLELADLIEEICSEKSWEGIIPKLWPNIKFIEGVFTGQMAQYIPTLDFYSNKLPLISTTYASSETYFGINVDPLCKPEDVSYTFLSNISYFEFSPIDDDDDDDGNNKEIVDLVDVKLGCYYQPVITTYSGLYRYKMDDILQVSGFHNNTPQFKFRRRKNVVLSIQVEATTETQLLNAVTEATLPLTSLDLMLIDFTSYADISTTPGHYVLYWELKPKNNNIHKYLISEIDKKKLLMEECCFLVEESLDALYRKERGKDGTIGPLEIKVVENGSFDLLMDYFVSCGASVSQYKTPKCIQSNEALMVLENKVLHRFFSRKAPRVDSKSFSEERGPV